MDSNDFGKQINDQAQAALPGDNVVALNDNVVSIDSAKAPTQQELIDDVGAQAFVFLRDTALEMDLPIKDVIVEHMTGLVMVMRSVEGLKETRKVLEYINDQLGESA